VAAGLSPLLALAFSLTVRQSASKALLLAHHRLFCISMRPWKPIETGASHLSFVMAIRTDTRSAALLRETSRSYAPDVLADVLGRARLQVLRSTVVICLLIALSNLVGAIAGFTASGRVTGPAITLGAAWCVLWAFGAMFPRITACCFTNWRITTLFLVAANVGTVAVTGGMVSPLLSVCMYTGWIASVVVQARAAAVMSLMIAGSLFAGYLFAGASIADVLSGPYRHAAVTSAVLPIVTGAVGVLLASVTNTTFGQLGDTLQALRCGAEATTPAMTALLAGRPVLALPAAYSQSAHATASGAPLTNAEREVVAMLADGHRPKQIALLRGVALSTVRSQIKAAKKKTRVRTIDELVAVAWDAGSS
jgi:DNA-binding CsgD family transcriptional regulator